MMGEDNVDYLYADPASGHSAWRKRAAARDSLWGGARNCRLGQFERELR
jgi:hypothetical protein